MFNFLRTLFTQNVPVVVSVMGGIVKAVLTGSLTSVSNSGPVTVMGRFNVSYWGVFVATIQIQRSFDSGATWLPVHRDLAGNVLSHTAAASFYLEEPEDGVQYRVSCTAFTSGTINYRISQ